VSGALSGLVRAILLVALGSAAVGCYAAVGPSIGYVPAAHRMTMGWELSAATFATGQSYAVGGSAPLEATSGSGRWARRTYLVWEPRFGFLPGLVGERQGSSAFATAGAGATLGARWDAAPSESGPGRAAMLGGVWGGGAYVLSGSDQAVCDEDWRTTFSLALGFRGGEFYLTPKVGVLNVPEVCINFDLNFN
jgi:hypothetical protein